MLGRERHFFGQLPLSEPTSENGSDREGHGEGAMDAVVPARRGIICLHSLRPSYRVKYLVRIDSLVGMAGKRFRDRGRER
jgi:hypothetical protein